MGADYLNPQILEQMKHTPDDQIIAELLEALEMLLTIEPNHFSADAYEHSLWENARAAIAKATGKK